jgi:uncharacterized protein (DUF58 family)
MAAAIPPEVLRKLEGFRLTVRRFRWGDRLGGRFVINRRGSSVEFDDYSPYVPGDDIRAIDWNLYARLDRLFIRTYREEVELTAQILIDATASMGVPTPRKFERAAQLGLALAYVGLAKGHRVRVSWMRAGPIAATPWLARRTDVERLAAQADGIRPEGTESMRAWMQRAIGLLRIRGGQVIVISDWLMPPTDAFQALQALRRRHVEVKALQVLTPEELDPARIARAGLVVDAETGQTHELAYSAAELAQAVLDHNERMARFCARHGILFAQHRLDEPLAETLLRRMPAAGILEPVR